LWTLHVGRESRLRRFRHVRRPGRAGKGGEKIGIEAPEIPEFQVQGRNHNEETMYAA
jgi:hypothetical protein